MTKSSTLASVFGIVALALWGARPQVAGAG